MRPIHVEVLHTPDCPDWQAVRQRIELLAYREGIAMSVIATRVDTPEQAASLRFHGSPTVLVEGVDVDLRAAQGPPDLGLG
jgi:hypothetical protein